MNEKIISNPMPRASVVLTDNLVIAKFFFFELGTISRNARAPRIPKLKQRESSGRLDIINNHKLIRLKI